MRRSAVAAVVIALTSAPCLAFADESEPSSAPADDAPADDAPARVTPAASASGDALAEGFTFGVQAAGGLGPAFTFLGLGVPITFGVPLSFGIAPGIVFRTVHLRLLLSFSRAGERSRSEFGGTTTIQSQWATSFVAAPTVEIGVLTLGPLHAFVLGGVQVGVLSTLSRTDNGMMDTRTKDTAPQYGVHGGFGFRVMFAPHVGLGATGGVQWFAITNSDPSGNSRTTDSTFNAFGTIDVTAFFGGL